MLRFFAMIQFGLPQKRGRSPAMKN